MRLPTIRIQPSQCLNIIGQKFYHKRSLAAPPHIALKAAGQSLAVVVDLFERRAERSQFIKSTLIEQAACD
jgi:hypothetical protein